MERKKVQFSSYFQTFGVVNAIKFMYPLLKSTQLFFSSHTTNYQKFPADTDKCSFIRDKSPPAGTD